jgi:hypothetical protein
MAPYWTPASAADQEARVGYSADADEPPAESAFTDLMKAMIFHISSSDLTISPNGGMGPTTFSDPLRL